MIKDELLQYQMDSNIAAFIEHLDSMHPPRCIKANEDLIQAHRYAAVREYIDELIALKVEWMESEDESTGDVSG